MQSTRQLRKTAAVSGLMLAIALAGCERPANEGQSQVVDGLRFDYGVVKGEVVSEHPSDHPERAMHLGIPMGSDGYHVVLAVFDAKTGARVKDAEVALELSGPGHPGHVVMPLEPMAAVGDVTYGGYVSLPSPAKYRLTFNAAHAGGRHATVKARFVFERPS